MNCCRRYIYSVLLCFMNRDFIPVISEKLLKMEGEVVIFSKTGCPHSLHAKQTLRESDLLFTEILVDDNQEIADYLKELTNRSSLPQIFFNGDNIGGNDSLQSLKLETSKWEEIIQDLMTNKTRKVFTFNSQPKHGLSNDEFSCEPDEKASIMKKLIEEGIFNTCRRGIFNQKLIKSITPLSFIEWYNSTKNTVDDEAETILRDIINKKYLIPVDNSVDSKTIIELNNNLRLNDGSDSTALNSGTATFCKLENVGSLGKLLQKNLLQLYNNHVSTDGMKVDYAEMKNSPSFTEYLGLCKELQLSPVEDFSDDEKKSFFINVYNSMVIHNTIQNGSPNGPWGWFKLFSSVKYIIGGREYSLDDIESGILRGNERPALSFFRPFASSDCRLCLIFKNPDPRIHFALNCGMKDCPQLKIYTAENIDEELRLATASYLSSEKGVHIEVGEDSSIIHLSSVFKWYASDFGTSPQEVMDWILSQISGEKKLQLEDALSAKNKISYIYCEAKSNANN